VALGLDVVVRADRDLQRFVEVQVEVSEAEEGGAVRLRVPAVEDRHDRLAARSQHLHGPLAGVPGNLLVPLLPGSDLCSERDRPDEESRPQQRAKLHHHPHPWGWYGIGRGVEPLSRNGVGLRRLEGATTRARAAAAPLLRYRTVSRLSTSAFFLSRSSRASWKSSSLSK